MLEDSTRDGLDALAHETTALACKVPALATPLAMAREALDEALLRVTLARQHDDP